VIREADGSERSWPDVDISRWAGTKRSLHLYAQMLGKVKLAAAPVQPNWLFTALYLSPRGLTTGTIPWLGWSFDVSIDVFDSAIVLSRSDGARATVPLIPARPVADVYADLMRTLATLGVSLSIGTVPQEVPDTTPLDEDRRPSEYDPAAAQRWFTAATAVAGIFAQWRSRFFGRTGLQMWWGAFDLALLLFSGRRAAPPTDRGYLMRYDLDAEMMNVGLYFGHPQSPPFFYGYIYPEPAGAESLPIAPGQASWSSGLHEWVLPYEAVRQSADPAATLHSFIDAVYAQCFAAAGWPRGAFSYDPPPIASRAHQSSSGDRV
jgi:hypothetical protein